MAYLGKQAPIMKQTRQLPIIDITLGQLGIHPNSFIIEIPMISETTESGILKGDSAIQEEIEKSKSTVGYPIVLLGEDAAEFGTFDGKQQLKLGDRIMLYPDTMYVEMIIYKNAISKSLMSIRICNKDDIMIFLK